MKYKHILGLFTVCFAVTLAIQSQSQDNSFIGSFSTPYTPYLQGAIWSGNQKDTLIRSSVFGYRNNHSIYSTKKLGVLPEHLPLIILYDRQLTYLTNYLLQTIEYLTAYDQVPRPVVVTIAAGRKPNQLSGKAQWGTDGHGGSSETMDECIFYELLHFMGLNYSIDTMNI